MKINEKITRVIEKIQWGLSHPGIAWAQLFANDDSAAWMFGLISALAWFFMAFSSSNLNWPPLAVLVVGVAVFFFVTQIYQMMPTSDEYWGRAPKRKTSLVFYVLAAIIVLALIINSALFINWAG